MNKRQNSTLSMLKSVSSHLRDNKAKWTDVRPLQDAVTELDTAISQIETQAKQQEEKGSGGYTADKQNKLQIATELALSLCLRMRPYARKTKNEVLLALVDHSKRSLEDGPEVEVLNRCKTISEQAKLFKVDLADYMITDQEVINLDQSIVDATPLTAKRDTIQDQRAQVTAALANIFTNLHETLDTMDDLIAGGFSDTEEEFVSVYFNTRKTTDRVGRHNKPDSPDENTEKG